MFKRIVCLLLVLSVFSSLYASDPGGILGSSIEKYDSDTGTGGMLGTSDKRTMPGMFIYPYGGIGLSFADYTAYSGSDLGLFVDNDPTLYKDDEYGYPVVWGLGVMADYFVTDRIAVTTGISLDSSEFRTEYPPNTAYGSISIKADFSFMTIPAGIHYYFEKFLVAGGGFYFAKLLSDEGTVQVGDVSVGGSLGAKDDFGIFIDLGFNCKLNSGNSVVVFARYKRGLLKIYDEDDIVTDISLRTLTLNVAYGIRI